MYNRYIRNDNGSYTRIPEDEQSQYHPSPSDGPSDFKNAGHPNDPEGPGRMGGFNNSSASQPPPAPPHHTGGRANDGLTGFLRHLLDQLHLDHVDTGDLLILVLLFFLFREDADEELLVALGLLLIL